MSMPCDSTLPARRARVLFEEEAFVGDVLVED